MIISRRYGLFSHAIAMIAAASFAFRDFGARLYDRAASWLDDAFALFRPEPFALAGGFDLDVRRDGDPLDPALVNGLRFEADHKHRSAARNT